MKAALVYAQKFGWRVLPVEPGGKRPTLKDWPQEATTDPKRIAEFFADPSANIGVATGAGSGLLVLDVDPRNGGLESLAELEAEHGPLPDTCQQATPSGGFHYVFKHAPGLSNSAGKLGPGLDIRTDGGQFVVAPSKTTGPYRWVKAPWDVPPAEAPAWLVERLSRAQISDSAAPSDRGWFPPASEAVLDAARSALDRHGPAIEGDGGDTHTMQAAAILAHDFALTDEEAWPLLVEWNADCQPPWEEDDLRTKLRNGARYGKAAYGCRRSMDSLVVLKKLITDWDRTEPGMVRMIERARSVVLHSGDTSIRGIAQRDLISATGLKAKDINLPNPRPLEEERPPGSIEVTTRIHEVADESTKAIARRVFQRNGVLCEVVKQERTFISDMEPPRIQDLMSQCAEYTRTDEKKGMVTQAAPGPIASILHARRGHAGVRILEAVTTAPVFLADGTILQERGYNAQARVFLEPNVTVDVLEDPEIEDAQAAIALFRDLLCDFKFHSDADFSSWLAGLLTPLVKAGTGNAPSPLVCISASNAGAGKSLLTDAISLIVTGEKAQMRPYKPKDPAEWAKSLTSFVRSGTPVSVLDNCNGPIGDDGLNRLITSSTWSDRILGASDAVPLPNVSTWFATGNNIEPVDDMVRRVLMVRIEVDTERPQERTGFRYDLEGGHAGTHRAQLLSGALTILRAFHVAGRPAQKLASWGSFSSWSALVRGALVWAGCADPFLTQKRAAAELNEPEEEVHDFWLEIVAESDGTAKSIAALANQRGVVDLLALREDITPQRLKRFLGRFVDKPRGGKRIRRKDGRYTVEQI